MAGQDLSALCVECGLCCDGSLFRFLPVEPGDVERHRVLGLPVVTQSGRLAMPLPCAKLEAKCCTVYAQRPPGCRGFVCHLGHRLGAGEVPFPEALATVREAQRRIEVLARVWPGDGPVVQRTTQRALAGAAPGEPALDALREVQEWLDDRIHWPDAPEAGV